MIRDITVPHGKHPSISAPWTSLAFHTPQESLTCPGTPAPGSPHPTQGPLHTCAWPQEGVRVRCTHPGVHVGLSLELQCGVPPNSVSLRALQE